MIDDQNLHYSTNVAPQASDRLKDAPHQRLRPPPCHHRRHYLKATDPVVKQDAGETASSATPGLLKSTQKIDTMLV